MNLKQKFRNGFTLVEVLIALGISAFVFTWAATLYVNVTGGSTKIQLERELFESGRQTLERVVNEFREGTVDYAEYWNKSREGQGDCGQYIGYDVNNDGDTSGYEQENYSSTGGVYGGLEDEYGKCSVHYEGSFWKYGTIGDTENSADPFIRGKNNRFYQSNDDNDYVVDADTNPDAIGPYIDWDGDSSDDFWQEELYLLNEAGDEKTIIRRRTNLGNKCYGVAEQSRIDRDNSSIAIQDIEYCRIEILKMSGVDTDLDGTVDTWSLADGYDQFQVISSPDIDVVDLRFFIAPAEDPNLGYSESAAKQTHPHVTIIYSAQVNPQKNALISGDFPQMTVQTTVGSRIYRERK